MLYLLGIMANKEHRELAQFLKEVHSKLRKSTLELGMDQAWQNHCNNKVLLQRYSHFMAKLATTHWENNCADESNGAASRIQWVNEFCYEYFINKLCIKYMIKEVDIAKKMNITLTVQDNHLVPIKLLDVGSCYNPFRIYSYFDVTAIDLCPANESVLECDFLKVSLGTEMNSSDNKVLQLQQNYYNVVVFCFLLEYLPASELRIKACENAYRVLTPGGILIITTPDSKHVGANSKIMKCWQYTLAKMGFMRIKYEKLKHMHCMAFRKTTCKDTAVRWALLHQQPQMEFALHIPQDYNNNNEPAEKIQNTELFTVSEDFQELPFSDYYGI